MVTIVSSCFCGALRQWRRGNIALITTLSALDCPNSVQCCQLRLVSDCTAFVASSNKSACPHSHRSHILLTKTICPEGGRQFASRALLTNHDLPSGTGYPRFISLRPPPAVAVFTEVDRVQLAVVSHRNGNNITELEALCVALRGVAHVHDPHGVRATVLNRSGRSPTYPSCCSVHFHIMLQTRTRDSQYPQILSVPLSASSCANLQHCAWSFCLTSVPFPLTPTPDSPEGPISTSKPWGSRCRIPGGVTSSSIRFPPLFGFDPFPSRRNSPQWELRISTSVFIPPKYP